MEQGNVEASNCGCREGRWTSSWGNSLHLAAQHHHRSCERRAAASDHRANIWHQRRNDRASLWPPYKRCRYESLGGSSAMTDLLVIDAYLHAINGDLRRLADVIERGLPLDETTRKFLASFLRGDIKRSRGQKRTWQHRQKDSETLRMVHYLANYEKMASKLAKDSGKKHSPRGGEASYLAIHPDVNEHTLKSILRRARLDKAKRQKMRATRVKK